MKKILILIGGLFGIVLLLLFLAPLFIDVNKFRPQIIAAVEQNLNAEVELGKLSLSVWGGLKIGIEKLAVFERGVKAPPVFAMKDARLDVALLPLLGGKAEVTLKVAGPQIGLSKGKDGKLNVMRLIKPSKGETPQASGAQKGPGAGGAAAAGLDVSVEITDGRISYSDEIMGTKTGLSGLSLGLYHIGVNRPVGIKFQSAMDVKGIKDLTLSGKSNLNGTVSFMVRAEGFDRVTTDLNLDATDLVIKYGSLFNKSDKVPLKLLVQLDASASDLNMKKIHAALNDLAVDIHGTVKNFNAPTLDLSVKSTKFVLEDWKGVLGMLKDFDAKGSADFDVRVSGPATAMNINGSANVNGVSLKLAALTQPISNLNAKLKFTQDSADVASFSMNIGSSDLSAKGSIKNFNKPQVSLVASSKVFDLDAMLPQKTPEQIKQAEEAEKNAKPLTDADIVAMTDGPLKAMRSNPMLKVLVFKAQAQMGKVRMNKADITNIKAVMEFSDLVLSLKQASAKVFDGGASFTTAVDFKPAAPTYKINGEVSGMDINAAVASQMESLKDTVLGKLFAKFDISGAGVTRAKVKTTLVGKGNFRLESGSWNALKVLQQIGEKLSSIPGAKDKLGGIVISGKIKKATSDFNIGGGRFNILNLVAELEESNTGVLGQGFVDFDKNLQLAGRILIPATVPQSLKHTDGRAALPYEVGCLATAPCFKSEATLKPVAEAFGKEEAKKAATAGLQKLKESVKDEKVKQVLDKVDSKTVEDVLKGIKF